MCKAGNLHIIFCEYSWSNNMFDTVKVCGRPRRVFDFKKAMKKI